jgi:hypothetical protein
MMIAPAQATGPSVLDLVSQATHLWSQMLLAPLTWGQSLVPAPPVPVAKPAAAAELAALAQAEQPVTDHALLVLLGRFAQHLGLVRLLEAVPLVQKTVTHSPQAKLIEFLLAVLAGLGQLQELTHASNPIASDTLLAQAWGQKAFADYSGVSRTLAAADADTLLAVRELLAHISRPFIERELMAIVHTQQPITIDIDLTGRPVSPTATSYPDAAFGWMDDAVAKGYQSAISSLSGGPAGRLLLASQRYSGKAKSAECLQAAVRAAEAALGLRPRRRVELLEAQLQKLVAEEGEQQQQLEAAREVLDTAQWKQERHVRNSPRRDERFEQQQARLKARVERTRGKVERLLKQVEGLKERQQQLTAWHEQLAGENQALVAPLKLVLRLDAGFATEANLAWLVEMGYTVLTKAYSGHTTSRLQRGVEPEAAWSRVGSNAEALPMGQYEVGEGAYGLSALQVRYQLPEGWRYTTLLWYDEAPPPAPKEWFVRYNGRQTLEAGIKENKAVFTMRRPLVRSPIGMQVQEAFALFAANFVRWAACWVREQIRDVPSALKTALSEVKTLVRVLAHSRAQVVESEMGTALVFDAQSPFAGAVLVIRGAPVYQTVLPLFAADEIAPQEVT